MLLIDPSSVSVYRVSRTELENIESAEHPTPMSFDSFEQAARLSYSSIIMETAGFPKFLRVRIRTIVFVRLRDGKGYAWASPVRVSHSGQYPAIRKEKILGRDILLLWPMPMAINAYLNFKERARLNPNLLSLQTVINHPPNMQHAQRCPDDFVLEGKVAMRDLTVAQRFFIASLAPNLPAFALRQSADDWWKRLCESDASNFQHTLVSFSDALRVKFRPSHAVFPPVVRLHNPPRKRKRCGKVLLDLPDELVARIACIRISEDMGAIEHLVFTVASLSAVSHQFRVCTHDLVEGMIWQVQLAARTLGSCASVDPRRVQDDLWASGLTLRHAFGLSNACHPCFHAYVHARRRLLAQEGNGGQPSAEERRAILWD